MANPLPGGIQEALEALQATECSGQSERRALADEVRATSTKLSLPVVMGVQKELLELSILLDGDDTGMQWLLQLLADHLMLHIESLTKCAKKDEGEVLEHLEGLAAMASPFICDTVAASVDFFSAVYTAGVLFGAKCSDKLTPDLLLTELHGLQGSVKLLTTSATSTQAVKTRAINALRDVILLLAHDSVKEQHVIDQPSERWLSVKIPSQREELFNADAVIADCTETLVAVLEAPMTNPINLMNALSALNVITRCRPSTWPKIIPSVCGVVERLFAGTRPKQGTAGSANSLFKMSNACLHALHRFLRFVIQISKAVAFHREVKAALAASGGVERTEGAAITGQAPLSRDLKKITETTPTDLVRPALDDALDTGKGAADGEGDEMPGEEGELPGLADTSFAPATEVLATTSRGPITSLDVIVAMVIRSLQGISEHSDKIEVAHQKGLRQMQLTAAKKAQALEIERIKQHESQSIAEIPAGRLVEHVDTGYSAMEEAESLLASANRRAMFTRMAFFSALETCRHIRFESEPRMRHAHAVVARTFCELPLPAVDSASDALCDFVQKSLVGGEMPLQLREFVMQVLFMRYTQLAVPPSGMGHVFASLTSASERQRVLDSSSEQGFRLLLEDPIAWMTSHAKRKRRRHVDEEEESEQALEFLEDKPGVITAYSHLLLRLLSVLFRCGSLRGLEEVLIGAPAITVPAWLWIHKTLCLNDEPLLGLSEDDRRRMAEEVNKGSTEARDRHNQTWQRQTTLGIRILGNIIRQRPVYRLQALSLLLAYSSYTKPLPRFLSIRTLREFVAVPFESNDWQQVILDYAKMCVGRISGWRIAKFEALQPGEEEGDEVERRKHAQKKFEALINRHVGLFLFLTAIPQHVTIMFRQLMDVLVQCNQQHNLDAPSVLLSSQDFEKFVCLLYKSPELFLKVLGELGGFPQGAEALVHNTLRIFVAQLQSEAHKALGGIGEESQKQTSAKQLQVTVKTLLRLCEKLYEETHVTMADPTGVQGATTMVNDARFIVPVLSFVERNQLRSKYIPTLLRFAALPFPGLEVDTLEYALREMLTPCRIAFSRDDGDASSVAIDRGMDPVSLMVYLHQLHQHGIQFGVTEKMIVAGINTLLKMQRAIGAGAERRTEPLFSPNLSADALQHLIRSDPVPTLTMRTALVMSKLHKEDVHLLRFISNTIVKELIHTAIWTKDETLWRGVVVFLSQHWPQYNTKEYLLRLPQQLLLSTLRQPQNKELLEAVLQSLPTLPPQYTELLSEFAGSTNQ